MAQQDLQASVYGIGPEDLQSSIKGTYSLFIENFSLGIEQYIAASSSICVDIGDYVNRISTTSGTYFIVNDVVVSGTFTPIIGYGVTVSGGAYRMCYDSVDDSSSLIGRLAGFVVHVTNDLGATREKDYYLTYGYKVEFENFDRKWMDFGYGTQVVVRIVAENLASCPKKDSTAYWFETRQPYSRDLSCSIKGSFIDDLPASIYPQSTAYFYGQTYSVVVTAKDHSGNEMQEFVLVYTIENEN